MQYDPVKSSLGEIFNRTVFLRKLFYRLLDLLLLRSWHIRKELKALKREGFAPKEILDAGSGFGQYVFFLARLFPGSRITGLDIKKEQIEDCNHFFEQTGFAERVGFHVGNLTVYRKEEAYDLILSVDVMEHIEEDTAVFKNFYKNLVPGGILLISTPSDQGGSDVRHDHDTSFIDEHVRDGYGTAEIRQKLSASGFSDIKIHYSYGDPGKLSWRLSMKYPVQMVNISKFFLLLLPVYYLLTFPLSWFLNCLDVRQNHETGTGLIIKCVK
ncbi:MAG: class I SAM-dependent methyltransferase [Bacteroidales bacterium]|nr:class I SAM-dependent methyltransferase [Bacteroidales bacterium]MBN2698559.1 class I SAM-dependent methyltransferase [Bacteroidales bacterium]